MFKRTSQVFKTFSRNERYAFLAAFSAFIVVSILLLVRFLEQSTVLVPANGGEYQEGAIGQPTFINPVLVGNNDVDRDLTEIIFDNVLDLAESYKKDKEGANWNVRLKENIFWHDDEKITSDDVIFTVKTIQNPDTRSPLFPNWQGVIVERVSEREIKFVLPSPYVFFEKTLKELRPIPKHLFGDIPPANLKLSIYSLEPIGSGPFQFESVQKQRDGFITEYDLVRNKNYYSKRPYLERFVLKFYPNGDELIKAFNSGIIDGFGGAYPKDLTALEINYQNYVFTIPRYYAIFFNPNSQLLLNDENIRWALDLAVDRRPLIEQVFAGQALSVFGPLTLLMEGYNRKIIPENGFNPEKANQLLDDDGWKINAEGIREKEFIQGKEKEVSKLEFNLVVPEIPFLIETANILKENWREIGVKLNLKILAAADVNNEIIKTRDYEMLLFGNIFGRNPDLFSFWHSSERFYPGLNLSLYKNKLVDALIERVRRNFDKEEREADLIKLQSLIIKDRPAIFLFSPFYLYISKKEIGGLKGGVIPLPSARFENIENWYLKTERRFK